MFFSNSYIQFSKELDINNYKHNTYIMSNFIKKYVEKNKNNKIPLKNIYEDALIYSKYYLHYKTINCVYTTDIMNILLYIEK